MIEKALKYLVGLAPVDRFQVGGREYTGKGILPVKEPVPESVSLKTLTGFVDYYKECDQDFVEDVAVVLILGPIDVALYSSLFGRFAQRKKFAVAEVEPSPFRFGQHLALEDFIVSLQAQFVDNPDLQKALKFVGNIEDSRVVRYTDDGVTQGMAAKVGIARVENVPVPRILKLAPYRTFLEVEQPQSNFILRMRQGKEGAEPTAALFEADGGKWKNEAVKNIEKFLRKELPKAIILA